MTRARATTGAAIAALAMLLSAAAAGGNVASRPLALRSASLTQNGRQLVWQVVLNQPFSPGALARHGQSICLVAAQGPPSHRVHLCLAGPARHHRQPRLIATSATTRAAGQVIPASVTRISRQELTAAFAPQSAGLAYAATRWQVVSTSARGCAATAGGPASGPCRDVLPAHPARLALHLPRVIGCVAAGPRWVFHGPSGVRQVALTFDDGPSGEPPTSAFLKLLARDHVPATFFEIGRQIREYDPSGAVERQMLAEGDMIGDHTWSHPDMARLSATAQRRQILEGAAAIRGATGFQPCLFRDPYGDVNGGLVTLARSLGFSTIQWDVDPRDWALPGVAAIARNVIANAHAGAIIIQHFGGGPRYQTLEALPAEIAALRARGYRFVTVTQMLGYRLIYG